MFGSVFSYFPHLFAMFGVGIAKSFKIIHFTNSKSNAAAYFQPFVTEILLCLFKRSVGNNQQVAVGFEVNLVHFDLPGNDVPGRV